MAFSFIGISPDPLPLPDGLNLDSRRFAGISSIPQEQRPRAPSKLRIKYTVTDAEGRIKNETTVLDPLPEHCTVRDLQFLIHEHLSISPRHPIELRYWGQPLEILGSGVVGQEHTDRPLSYYSIKDHSELTVIVKPMLPLAQARLLVRAEGQVTRLRVMSHKLGAAIPLEGLTPDLKVGDLKRLIKEYLARAPIYLVAGPTPPVPNPPTVAFTLAEPLADGTAVIEARVGDHLVADAAAGGGKGKGGGTLRRISDGKAGTVAETDLWKFQIEPEQRPTLQYSGFVLDDESLITTHSFLQNEILMLNFKAPWEPDEPIIVAKESKGGKKKK